MSVCDSRVPARGFPPPLPPEPNLVGWGSSAFPWSALLFAPHFPPSHLFAPPPGFSLPRPTATLGYCFRVGVTSRVKELRLGAGPGRAALTMPRSRVGDTPAGRGRRNPPVPERASSREICPFFLPVRYRPCSFPDFSKIQISTYPAPTSSDLERFTERRMHGVGLCNLRTLLPFFSSVQWV